jgi:hypothetical protein
MGPTLRPGALGQVINSIDNFIAGYELSDGQLEHLKALRMRVQVELEG